MPDLNQGEVIYWWGIVGSEMGSDSATAASVVICAYTEARWDYLVAAVESVKRQATPAREIILVVDHNSILLERVRANIDDVAVIENTAPRGLAGARNTGVATSTSDVVVFLDDDAAAEPDWLSWLLAGYRDESVLGVGGVIRPLWEGPTPAWFPQEFLWVVGCSYLGVPQKNTPVRNFIGANMSFRRSVFGEVGGFRQGMGRIDSLPAGCEETEFCIRVRQQLPAGYLVHEPRALVYHRVPEERARWGYFSARCYAEGLSKAVVSRSVGVRDGLAMERVHAGRTLPAGVLRALIRAITGRSPSGLGVAAAIVLGLAITTTGYLKGALWDQWVLAVRRRPAGIQRAPWVGGVDGDGRGV